MQIVINISDIDYDDIKEYGTILDECRDDIAKAIINGTPLPKGHGRLIDADGLVPDCQEDSVYYDDDEHNVFTAVGIAQIECADTILEADKSEGEE